MKKIGLILVVTVLFFGVVACKKGGDNSNQNAEVVETKTVVDVTERNKELVFGVPGDVILLRLLSEEGSERQWSLREPVTGGYLNLKEHNVYTNQGNGKNMVVSEWKLKIIKEGKFPIKFHLEDALNPSDPIDIFQIYVLSDTPEKEAKNIYLLSPEDNDQIQGELDIKGYARVFEGTVNYEIRTTENDLIEEGYIQAAQGPPKYGMFQAKIDSQEFAKGTYLLNVFQISARDGEHTDKITARFIIN